MDIKDKVYVHCKTCGTPMRVDFVDGKIAEVYKVCRCANG